METVIVERKFATRARFAELQAAETGVAWCLSQHQVRFVHSYLSLDGLAMVCVYAAPDAQAVRETQRRGGLPVERAWSAHVLDAAARVAAGSERSTIIVERELPQPMPPDMVRSMMASAESCLALHRAEHLATYLSHDLQRLLCVFEALDADRRLGGERG